MELTEERKIMERRKRVIDALNHKNTDIVPYNVEFTTQAYERIVSAYGENFVANQGFHLTVYQYWGWPEEKPALPPEHFRDEFGVVWNRSGADKDIGVVGKALITPEDVGKFTIPPVNEKRLRDELEKSIKGAGDTFAIAGIGFSMFERLWSFCTFEDALAYMLTEPDFVHKILDMICERNIKIIDIICEYPFDAVYFGDDWGQQRGLIMGPRLWRQFIKPRMSEMYERVKSHGKFVMQHSCGDIHEILYDLIDIGLDCYQTFQPEIYDIVEIKKEFGQSLSFWGGISTQRLLPFASPEEVKAETKRIMGIMSQNGGYIAAPTHAVPGDVPPENILAMCEAFKSQGEI